MAKSVFLIHDVLAKPFGREARWIKEVLSRLSCLSENSPDLQIL